MLLTIRRKSQGWVAWLIVLIIAIPFALFGINSYFEGANQVTIAKVDGETINAQTFEREMEQRRRLFRSQLGNNFNPAMVDNPAFREQVVEGLVSNQLIQSYAQDNGLRLSDQALRNQLLSTPQFQSEGQFDRDTYRRVLSARGFSTEGYEQQARVRGGIVQLESAIAQSALVNPLEINQLLTLDLQKRDADFVIFNAKDNESEVELSEDEMRKEYDQNEAAYQQADRMKLSYIKLTLDDIAKDIELDDEEIASAYESSKGQYIKPEVRIASHILFSVARAADDTAENEALDKANEALQRLETGGDFSKLAQELSDDPGSKRSGGDLGIIAKGQMVPEFEEKVFGMVQGEISEPVKTEFGYHIIKLTSLEPESQKQFESVKAEVEAAEKQRMALAEFTEISETFRTLVFENPDSLEITSGDMGLEIQTSDWVTRDFGQGDFANSNVRAAAFDQAVLDEDLNSEVIEIGDDTLLAMHKNEFEAQHTKSFEEVQAQIEAKLIAEKAAQIAESQGRALMEQINANALPEETVFTSLAELKAESRAAPENQVAEQVFKQKLSDGGETVDGFVLANGDFAVYRLKGVTPGDPTQATEVQRAEIERQLQARDGNNAYMVFRQALRKNSDVEIFTSLLEDDADITPYGQQEAQY